MGQPAGRHLHWLCHRGTDSAQPPGSGRRAGCAGTGVHCPGCRQRPHPLTVAPLAWCAGRRHRRRSHAPSLPPRCPPPRRPPSLGRRICAACGPSRSPSRSVIVRLIVLRRSHLVLLHDCQMGIQQPLCHQLLHRLQQWRQRQGQEGAGQGSKRAGGGKREEMTAWHPVARALQLSQAAAIAKHAP